MAARDYALSSLAWSCLVEARVGSSLADVENPMLEMDFFRALHQGDIDHLVANNGVSDIIGTLKYLHTQIVVETGKDKDRISRPNSIDAIARWRFKVKNPPGLLQSDRSLYTDFGIYTDFQYGQLNNWDGGRMEPSIQTYGDQVGLQEQLSLQQVKSPMPYFWFSLGGFCPNLPFECTKSWRNCSSGISTLRCEDPTRAPTQSPTHELGCPGKGDLASPNELCLKYNNTGDVVRGGLCPGGFHNSSVRPTGQPGCVYSYGQEESVLLDDLVGIVGHLCRNVQGETYACRGWSDWRAHCSDDSYRRKFSNNGDIVPTTYCVEYDIHPDCVNDCRAPKCAEVLPSKREMGLPFWQGRCDSQLTMQRAERVASYFQGFGSATSTHSLLADDLRSSTSSPSCMWPGARSQCTPNALTGDSYCTRTWAGVCHPCYIFGTVQGSTSRSAPPCPFDVLLTTEDYDTYRPRCHSNQPSQLCCLYVRGSCEGDHHPYNVSKVPLNWDGFLLVAKEQQSDLMERYMERLARSRTETNVMDPDGFRNFAYWLWFQDVDNREWEALSDDAAAQEQKFQSIAEQLSQYVGRATSTGQPTSFPDPPGPGYGGRAKGALVLCLVLMMILIASFVGVAWQRQKQHQERIERHSLAASNHFGTGSQQVGTSLNQSGIGLNQSGMASPSHHFSSAQ